MVQGVLDHFDDLVMDSNKSLKKYIKGSRRNGVRMAKRKRGMTFIPYDYEAAYNKSLEDMHEFFVEQMFKHGRKAVYVMTLLESPDRVRVIKDGEEIYNQYFANMEVDKDIVAQIGDAEVKLSSSSTIRCSVRN